MGVKVEDIQMINLEEQMLDYVAEINIRFKRWRECDPSTSVYKIKVFSGISQEEARELNLNQEEKDWMDNYF